MHIYNINYIVLCYEDIRFDNTYLVMHVYTTFWYIHFKQVFAWGVGYFMDFKT